MFARWKRGGYNKNCPNDRDNFADHFGHLDGGKKNQRNTTTS